MQLAKKLVSFAHSCGMDRDQNELSPEVNFTDVVGSNMLGKWIFICIKLWIGLNGETNPQQVYMW